MKSKYKQAKQIRSMSDFENSKSLWFKVKYGPKEKTTHRGWLESFQYHTLYMYIKSERIYEAEQEVNGMLHAYDDEDNAPMNERMLPAEKNCHERCCYSRPCYELYHCKGSHDASYPWECPIYSKLLDLDQETKDIPFFDPDYDLPEDDEDGTEQ